MVKNNHTYWKNREENAKKAYEQIKRTLNIPVEPSRVYSTLQDEKLKDIDKNSVGVEREAILVNEDSVTALFKQYRENKKICVLNFASYTEPGGKFLDGSKAQEESLCHESNLWHHLTQPKNNEYYKNFNYKHRENGFFMDRALYSPNVVFMRDGKEIRADVLTCAAANLSYVYRQMRNGATSTDVEEVHEKNYKVMRQRIKFIHEIMLAEGVDLAILGAWGCGVFRQAPDEIAKLFSEEFTDIECVYAIPSGFHSDNYDAFSKYFRER